MAIDKSLAQVPVGLGALDESDEDVITVILPEDEDMDEDESDEEETEEFSKNLAEELSEELLDEIAGELIGDVEKDLNDRKDWLETYVKGLKLLGLKYEDRSEPWPGACGVFHPLLMESAIKFQSETIMETFPAAGPVKTKIIGKETPEKVEAGARVQEDMNYQLTDVMTEYRPDHERTLMSLCLSGNAFKKIYFDTSLDRQTAPFVAAEDLIVPYGASSLESAERVTHRMRKTKNELRKLQVSGFYLDIDLGDPVNVIEEIEKQKAAEEGFSVSTDDRYQILEIQTELDLEGYEDKGEDGKRTGIKLPYIVTIDRGTTKVLSLRRNWMEDDKLKARRQHFVHYGYIPGFGFYYFGLIHLIGGHTQAATSLLRQLIDAGTLSNLPGGLKSNGLRIKGDDSPIAPGEFRDVDLPSGSIRDNILPLPYKEPSQTLAALMDRVVADGKEFASAADMKLSDMSAQTPVGTTLAILERTLKVMSAVQARIHYTMKQEFRLLAAIIRDHTPEEYDYEPDTGPASARKSDYDHVDVLPVSDPNASTMAQRVVQYQAVLQLAQTNPSIYDMTVLHRQMIETLGVKNADKLIPEKDDMKPLDPVSENMAVLMGKPVKAFLYQDHESHLVVHMAALQDPKMAAVIGQNPAAQAIMASAYAHIMEHVAYQYRKDIESQLGASLPPPPDFDGKDKDVGHMPEDLEVQVSQLAAAAGKRLLQKDQAEAQQQQAQQQAQDPLIQLQMADIQIEKQLADLEGQKQQLEGRLKEAELQLRAELDKAELERKAKKDLMDAAAKADEIRLREKEIDGRAGLETAKLEASNTQKMLDTQIQAANMADNIAIQEKNSSVQAAAKADEIRLKEAQLSGDGAHKGATLAHEQDKHAADVMSRIEDARLRREEMEASKAAEKSKTENKDK